jgi:hypothetical protein
MVVPGAIAGLAGEIAMDVSVGVGPGTTPPPPPSQAAKRAAKKKVAAMIIPDFRFTILSLCMVALRG